MYWGAISTDIKKSSVNWNNASGWMQKAVQFHNKIITQTVLYWKNKEIVEITKLPNSPEGDAFTFLFNHEKEFVLRRFVTRVAFDIQYLMALYRDKNGSEINMDCDDIKDYIKNEDIREKFKNINYYGGIFIRIGMAFSDEAPMSYEYKRFTGGRNTGKTKSYRGTVIYMSEEGEKRADYDLVPYNNGAELVKVPSIKECYYILDDEGKPTSKLGFRDVKTIPNIPETTQKCEIRTPMPRTRRRRSSMSVRTQTPPENNMSVKKIKEKLNGIFKDDETLAEDYCKAIDSESLEIIKKINNYSPETTTDKIEKGIAIFVKYHSVLDKSIAEHDIAALKYIREEYDDLHKKANEAILGFKTNNIFIGGLIKQKRDDSSMYVLRPDGGYLARRMVNLYKTLARLLAFLPHKSSIGVAVGDMTEVRYKDVIDNGTYVDYFGPAVNLAARMEFKDFEYNTDWGVIDSRTHQNRVAFTITEKMEKEENIIPPMEERLEKDQMPFQLDYMPLKALNVGSKGEASIISTKISGIPHIKVGMKVTQIQTNTRTPKEQEVLDVLGDKLLLRKNKNTETVPINKIKLKL
tara:strand:- start:206 stop:1939 length:1734 start_codon:yes stop_codon:yes gene_type:complete